jgi:hypothetical protein
MRWEVQMAAALLTRFPRARDRALRTPGQVRNWSARLQGEHRSNRVHIKCRARADSYRGRAGRRSIRSRRRGLQGHGDGRAR